MYGKVTLESHTAGENAMIQIQQLKLPITHTAKDLEEKILTALKIQKEQMKDYRIVKQSIDARKKQEIHYVYTIEADTADDRKIAGRIHGDSVRCMERKDYRFPASGGRPLKHRPIIAGSGPAGLICAYMLAMAGYEPVVLERGKTVEQRQQDVTRFWQEGILNTESNVQFGEGGAGAFSDGKLNTLVKDPLGRNRKVLEIFVAHGAPKEILYEAKPHIGTDMLARVIPAIRRAIIQLGGQFFFESCLTDLTVSDKKLTSVEINHTTKIDTDLLVLAIGHSARDTFSMLHSHQIPMEEKAFAVGLRIEHPQEMISRSQYGAAFAALPPAAYKVTARGRAGRGVYSFCMCPGGYVVNASSEKNRLAVNGMSYYKRDGANANSAIIVSVTPKDYKANGPLSGLAFQRRLEERAFQLGDGSIPQQLYGDFKRAQKSVSYGSFCSAACGKTQPAPLFQLFEQEIYESFLSGMEQFAKKIPGFDREDAILSGVESRTSSPVRIHRDASFQSEIRGIYPCGEGAGYAGGIMSAAMDGIKTAEAIASLYAPNKSENGRKYNFE